MDSLITADELPQVADRRPIPDPTSLTNRMVLRELSSLREIMEARMDGSDVLIRQMHDRLNAIPTMIDNKVENLHTLHEERFRSITTQFIERDERIEAALAAQKDVVTQHNLASAMATTKSEIATAKTIDQLNALFQTSATALHEKIDDIRNRVLVIEGRGTGRSESWGMLVGVVGMLVGVGGVILALIHR